MKKIGIIGGLGPESTVLYYKELITQFKEKSKGQYPEIIIYSVNLVEFNKYMAENDLDSLVKFLSGKVHALIKAGADFISIASNTPHIVFDRVSEKSKVPMISIVEETAKYADKISVIKKIGLLGTAYTMQTDFYPECFSRYGLKIYTPDKNERDFIQEKIFSELAVGNVVTKTRERFLAIIKLLIEQYAIDALVLGCTELPLILDKDYLGIKFLNTVKIHVDSIINYCIHDG